MIAGRALRLRAAMNRRWKDPTGGYPRNRRDELGGCGR
jgi:hypothetical protein